MPEKLAEGVEVGVGTLRLSTDSGAHRVDCRLPCYVYVSVHVEADWLFGLSLRCFVKASDDHELALKARKLSK